MDNDLLLLLEKLNIDWKQSSQGFVLKLEILVKPQAKKNLLEWDEMQFKVHIKEPAIEGKANAAVRDFLAKTLKVSKSSIELIRGEKGRKKTFLVLVQNDKLETLKNMLEKFYET